MQVKTQVAHNIYLKKIIVDVTVDGYYAENFFEYSCQYFMDWNFEKGVPSSNDIHTLQDLAREYAMGKLKQHVELADKPTRLVRTNPEVAPATEEKVSPALLAPVAAPIKEEVEAKPEPKKAPAKAKPIIVEVKPEPVVEAKPVVVAKPADKYVGSSPEQNALIIPKIAATLGANWKENASLLKQVKVLLTGMKGEDFSVEGVVTVQFLEKFVLGLQDIAASI